VDPSYSQNTTHSLQKIDLVRLVTGRKSLAVATPGSVEVDEKILVEFDCLIIIFGIENEDPLLFFDVLKEKETFI
jgi:hypothetical protein